MDNRKRGSPLLSFHGKIDGRGSGGMLQEASLEEEAEEVEVVDLFGDEDDDLFSMITEDSIRAEETKEYKSPQPSTSHQWFKPSAPAPNSRPVETLIGFDTQAGETWIYPINYPLREYQYSIVESSLFKNTLISLPTGLGKTFIAAVVMYNFYRWYPWCKVVFMAPTKPLVAQQVEACFSIMGIPQDHIAQMTGTFNPEKRTQEWVAKRVFFLTPQVLTNDLARGSSPAKLIKCLVLDEAHRAQGNHAYCQVVRGLKEHGHDFRIVALSATPGTDLMAVKQVLNNLYISNVELRSEDSPDIQPYTFHRNIEKVVVPFGDELTNLKERYLKVMRVYVNRLLELNVLHTRDETTLTKFQLLKSRECFRQNPPAGLPRVRFGVVEGLFALCMTLYHAYELMLQHGTRSFYRFLKETLAGAKSNYFARGELGHNGLFQSIMGELSKKFEADPSVSHCPEQSHSILFSQVGSPQAAQGPPQTPFVISHPKMAKLLSIVLEHHQKFADEGKSTRIMIFSQYRESVTEITEMLQQHYPLVKAMSFVGHNNQGRKGLSQKMQIQVVSKFRAGGYNTLVSTCVGEEGLDIGQVDLIICYDAPKSPIRLVQRMGRTGRQREGRIVVLVTKGREEQAYNSSQYRKKSINTALSDSGKLARYLTSTSPRMVPAGLTPRCLKLHMKVNEWKSNTKGTSKSPRGRGSIASMLKTGSSSSSSSSSSKNALAAPLMSKDEWRFYRSLQVPQEEMKILPPPSLVCLDAIKREVDGKKYINLGSYQPWQTLPQRTHVVGHSFRSLHLVEITEFIGLQQHIDPNEDPYGLEMAAFLDKAYIADDKEENDQLSPDFKQSRAKHRPATCEEEAKEKKGKRKQTAIPSKKKKQKVVQGTLITDMFTRMTQTQANDKKENQPKENDKREDVDAKQILGLSQSGVKGNVDINADVDVDDDVVCLMDDNLDVVKSTPPPGVVNGQKNDNEKLPIGATEPSTSNGREMEVRERLFVPLPKVTHLHFDLMSPPSSSEDEGEVEEPGSPTEVLEFCENWVLRNVKKRTKAERDVDAPSRSKDIFELSDAEGVAVTKNASTSEHFDDDASVIIDDDDFEQRPETSASLFTVGEISPVIGKAQGGKGKTAKDANDDEDKTWATPEGAGGATHLSDTDASPLVGRSNPSRCASTPKVASKCLLKKFAAGLSTIDEFSPVVRKDVTTSPSPSPSSVCLSSAKATKNSLTPSLPHAPQGHRNRFKSKLSRFAKPKAPDGECDVNSNVNVKGSEGMSSPKNYAADGEGKVTRESNAAGLSGGESNAKRGTEFPEEEVVECRNNSTFAFEDLNVTSTNYKLQGEKTQQKTETVRNGSHANVSNCARNSPQSSWRQKEENKVSVNTNTNTSEGRGSVVRVVRGAEAEFPKGNKQFEAECTTSPDLMEDCSLFERLDDLEADPRLTSATQRHNKSSFGVSVTQVLGYMNEVTQCTSTTSTTAQKPSQIHSQSVADKSLSRGQPSARSKLSLSRNRHESDINKSDKSDKSAEGAATSTTTSSTTSSTTATRDGSRLSLSRSNLSRSSHSIQQKTTQREDDKGKHVTFCTIGNDVGDEMSNELLDADFELMEMPLNAVDVQGENASSSKSTSSLFADERSQSQSTPRRPPSSKRGDDWTSKLVSPTQDETQLLVRRKRKACNVLGSDHDDSLFSSDSENEVSRASTTSGGTTTTATTSTSTTTTTTCVTTPLRKAVADRMKMHFVDDDDDFVEAAGPPQPQQQVKNVAKKKKKKKRKRHEYLDDEAELSMDVTRVSSDESEDEEREYDRSFVDDGTYLSQDNAQDMKAVYLRSVVSPLKARPPLKLPPPPKYIRDSESSEHEEEEEEEEDSFVVDNSFVEYDTEYAGETMLAEDPIINQALQDQGNARKTKDAAAGNKAKRKRIILNESTSDEEARGPTSSRSPVRAEPSKGAEKAPPAHRTSQTDVGNQTRNSVAIGNDETSCSKDPGDEDDFVIVMEISSSSRHIKGPIREVPVISGSKQRSPVSSNNKQSTDSPTHKNGQQVTSGSVVSDKRAVSTGGIGGKETGGDCGGVGGVSKAGGKGLEGLDTSLNHDPTPNQSSMEGSSLALSESSHLNTSNGSFFVASSPSGTSFTDSQSTQSSSPQEGVGVLVDSGEVNSGGNVLSLLRLRYGLHTAVVHLSHAHYALSTRTAVSRLPLTVLSSSQHKRQLVKRVQGMLQLYECPVLIVEDAAAHRGSTQEQAVARSSYLDTIVCACIQVVSLRVLYSKGQDETSYLLWHLLLQEKRNGFKISIVPKMNKKRQQMAKFYLTLPSVGYPTAIALAQNFTTVKEFINSPAECIQRKGSMSLKRAVALKGHLVRQFRPDMLP